MGRASEFKGDVPMNDTEIRDLTDTELDRVSGGTKNSDDPFVQAVLSAFNKTIADGQAAVLELARSSGGGLGSTSQF
jgi:hypothetical protein